MKTLSKLLVFILFFSFSNCVTAQKKTLAEITGIKMLKQKSVKGKSNEYRIEVYDTRYNIINKGNVYDKVLPNYNSVRRSVVWGDVRRSFQTTSG